MTDGAWVDAYLHRIEVEPDTKGEAGIDQLRHLQLAHLRSVPFENLSIHLGEPIVLRSESLLEKIVDRRRGGFCYELNGAFAALLEALGYRVHMHSARVHGVAGVSAPFDHMALTVELEHVWLVDVGFGSFTHHPVRLDLDADADQVDPAGVVRLKAAPDGDLDVWIGDQPQYRVDRRPYALGDFVPTCWWQATSPDSHFTRSLTCSMLTGDGRVTLSEDRLIVTTGGVREERMLADDTEIIEAYRSHFGIRLPRAPRLSRRD